LGVERNVLRCGAVSQAVVDLVFRSQEGADLLRAPQVREREEKETPTRVAVERQRERGGACCSDG
jgi:hypothetical protein